VNTIKIYIMTHKKFQEPEEKIYKPLQVGKALHPDLGYDGDDTGDSISALNPYYGELTGLYWIWKNDTENDFVGLCHYRRFFVKENHQLLQESDYKKIFENYDVIVSDTANTKESYFEEYKKAHYIKDLLLIRDIIKIKYPQYGATFDYLVAQNKCYYGNLFVASKQIFDAYAQWLFSIFFEAQKQIDVETYDDYHKRVFGFISEELLMVWLVYNRYNIYESNIGVTEEKAETVELKLALTQLVKNGQFTQARELFYEFTNIRPDVRLEMSDIFGELPIMEQLLYILEEEANNYINGTYSVTNYLPDMVKHYKKMLEIFSDIKEEKKDFTLEEAEYIKRNRLSGIFASVIFLNNPETSFDKVKVKQKLIQFFEQEEEIESANQMKQLPF